MTSTKTTPAADTDDTATRVGPMHEAFAAFLNGNFNAGITAEQVFLVTSKRKAFRSTSEYREGVKGAQADAKAQAAAAREQAKADRAAQRAAAQAEKEAAAQAAKAAKEAEAAKAAKTAPVETPAEPKPAAKRTTKAKATATATPAATA